MTDSDPQPSYLHLVRHGATAHNLMKPPRLQGRTQDHDLSDQGWAEAQQTARHFAARKLAAVYCSPLKRARQTAETIARPHGLPVEVVDSLAEVDVGSWENKQWNQIERDDPQQYRRFMEDPGAHGYPDGETMTDLLRRIAPTLNRLLSEHPGCEIVAVAHNVVNKAYLGHLLGISPAAARSLPQNNCGINLLRLKQGRVKAMTINAVTHLERLS